MIFRKLILWKLGIATVTATLITVALLGCGRREGSSAPTTQPSPAKTTSPQSTPEPSSAAASPERVASPLEEWVLEPPASVAGQLDRSDKMHFGPTLFQHYCSVCHGAEGKGDGRYYSNSLNVSPTNLVTANLSDDRITKVVREGTTAVGKSALCPPWGRVFSEEQVAAVVAHVKRLSSL